MKFCHFQRKVRTTKATPSRLILQLYLPPLIQSFRTFSKSQLKSYYAIQRYASDIWVYIFVVIDWLFSPKYALFIYKLENPHYYCKKKFKKWQQYSGTSMCDHLSSKRLSPISDRLSKTPKLPSQSLTVGSPSKRPPPVSDRDHSLGL